MKILKSRLVKVDKNLLFIAILFFLLVGGVMIEKRIRNNIKIADSISPTPTPTLALVCDNPKLKFSDEEKQTIRKTADGFIGKNYLGGFIDVSAPDTTIDCTNPKSVEEQYPMLDPALCKENPKNSKLALYSLGIYPSAMASTKTKIKSTLAGYAKDYGPFKFDFEDKALWTGCGMRLNYKNDSGKRFVVEIYKRLAGDTVYGVLIYPTNYDK